MRDVNSKKKCDLRDLLFYTFGLLFLTSESFSGFAVLSQFIDFLLARTPAEDEYMLRNEDWGSLGANLIATGPLSMLLVIILYGRHVHHEHLAQGTSQQDKTLCKKTIHNTSEGTAMVPFGLLAYSGTHDFLQKTRLFSPPVEIGIAAGLGVVSWLGNWKIHSVHLHAETGNAFTVFRDISPNSPRLPKCSAITGWTKTECKAFWMGIALVISHALQGFLDGDSFLDSIGTSNLGLRFAIPGLLAILVTAIEANSEARSIFTHYAKEASATARNLDTDYRARSGLRAFDRFYLGISAMWHSLQPAAGFLSLADVITKFVRNKYLYEVLPGGLPMRIGTTIVLFILSQPNTLGSYRLAEPALISMRGRDSEVNLRITEGGNGDREREERESLLAGENSSDHSSSSSVIHVPVPAGENGDAARARKFVWSARNGSAASVSPQTGQRMTPNDAYISDSEIYDALLSDEEKGAEGEEGAHSESFTINGSHQFRK